ncbi:MAG: hypothetical protein D3917_15335 [Candidatus Electrothrix sp. AX5]|jgi:hypothetical protein|nr:hypothetical protein [Candidatus Electrothrix sp. AX5]
MLFFRTQRSKTAEQPESLADLLTGYVGAIDSGELAQGGLQLSEGSGKNLLNFLAGNSSREKYDPDRYRAGSRSVRKNNEIHWK